MHRPSPTPPSAAPTAKPTSKPATLSHRLEYLGTRAAVFGLRLLGWRGASWVGGLIGRLVYSPIGIRAGVVERQISAAFPEYSRERVVQVSRRSYDSLGRTSIETAVLPGTSSQHVTDRVELVEGWELVDAALAKGKGLLIVTGHLGNWEFGGAYFAARGVPIDVVTRGMANPIFDAYLTRTRREIGMEVIPDKDAVRRTPRSLRENRAIAFVSDHDALGLASTFVPFFGRPAKTPRGPAVFALRFDVPTVFVAVVRQPSGRYAIVIEPVEVERTGDREVDIDAIVLRYTQILERLVRKYPEQYFWQHRRWRRQPPDTPPHLREP
ncbi:lysophospholipid acyltransferase family protein [Gemmatimonas sp.]|uniref:lysophospholipid acyltransferase family protein n=1 Tax=Gemmatimonas sp. TaxID=1962908 RepID=UPI0035643EE4